MRLRCFEALRHREYRLLWYGQVFSSMGTWMDQVTRGWLIYELTNLPCTRGLGARHSSDPVSFALADRRQHGRSLALASFGGERSSPMGFLYAVTAALIFTALIRTAACLCDGVF